MKKDGWMRQIKEQLAATKDEASRLSAGNFEQGKRRPRRLQDILMVVALTPPGERTGLSEEEQARYDEYLANQKLGIARKVIRNAEHSANSAPKSKPIRKLELNESRDGHYTLQLPSNLPKDKANEILRRVEEYLASE